VLPNLFAINDLFPRRNQSTVVQLAALASQVRDLIEQQVAACIPEAKPDTFAEQGCEYACIIRRAEVWSADLIVVGSYGRTDLAALPFGSVADHVTRHAHCPVLEGKLRQAIEHCGATGGTHVTHGSAGAAVVRAAEELEAELIVVGTRGRTGLVCVALGSVAERVIRSAPCPVLAVRLRGWGGAHDGIGLQ
jgi:nucleotide-binding universal stress UspA family protein